MPVTTLGVCRCGNEARYLSTRGEAMCALCPLTRGQDAIRISDVPKLLRWLRRTLPFLESLERWVSPWKATMVTITSELRTLLGRNMGDQPFELAADVSFNSERWTVVAHSDAHDPDYAYWLERSVLQLDGITRRTEKYPVPVVQAWLSPWKG